MKKIVLAILFIFLNCLCSSSQSNYRVENYGNLSILLSGNVTGSVEDLGLTYYNPARLAILENTAFTINAKAYQWNRLTLTDAVGIQNKLSSTSFNGIPSMVAGTFKLKFLKEHHFAFSFISKVKSKVSFNYETELQQSDFLDDFEGFEKHIEKVSIKNELKDEWFGLTWAKSLSENFSIGVSTFVSVYSHGASNVVSFDALHSQDRVASFHKEVSFVQESYGLYWKIGLAWRKPTIEYGLNISLPYLEIYSKGKFKYEEFLSGMGSGSDVFTFNDFDDLKSTRKIPFGIDLGVGIPIGKSKVHLNLDWHSTISKYNRIIIPEIQSETEDSKELIFTKELNSVFNYGLGTEIYISPKFKGVCSFSSDYSAITKNSNIFDLSTEKGQDVNLNFDLYHVGFGLEMQLKKSHLVFGGTFSTGNSTFDQPVDDFPNNNDLDEDEFAHLEIDRWRFIIGIDIPILTKKIVEITN